MRIDTAAKRAAYRACMIPAGAIKDGRSSEAGEVYAYEMAGKLYALAFRGSAGKSEWHHSFRSDEHREKHTAQWFADLADSVARKAERKAAVLGYVHDVQVGDIFRASWGYDQTNIDYYQCVALVGTKMMEVREICQQSEDTGYMQGNCVPTPDSWATEAYYDGDAEAYKAEHGSYPRREKAPMRVKIQGAGNEPCFRVASYCCAYRVKPMAVIAGKPIFNASHWTAYA